MGKRTHEIIKGGLPFLRRSETVKRISELKKTNLTGFFSILEDALKSGDTLVLQPVI
jgi:hypothetical protein